MNFDKEPRSDFFGGVRGVGELLLYNTKRQKKNNHLHNVEHVVQSTLGNMLITLTMKPKQYARRLYEVLY